MNLPAIQPDTFGGRRPQGNPPSSLFPTKRQRNRTKKGKRRREALKEELAATVLITPERKAAVTLSNAYNWEEWTNVDP